jgi:hypothetical protein
MKSFLSWIALVSLLVACGENKVVEDDLDITSRFNSALNIYEHFENDNEGNIVYHAQAWGGLIGTVTQRNMPVDWTRYESVTFEFAEPTPVATQIMLSEKLKTQAKKGVTSITCYFDGQDVKSVEEVVLQASDTCTLVIKRVYLTLNDATWETKTLWTGNCAFGPWENGFVVKPELFASARKGDKLEFVYHTDQSDPEVTYWLFKTCYNATDSTLEGNDNELNQWGCAYVGRQSTVYRIILTERDVTALKRVGMFVNGYYNTVSQVNLLSKQYIVAPDEEHQ